MMLLIIIKVILEWMNTISFLPSYLIIYNSKGIAYSVLDHFNYVRYK